jgi:long-chain acyl-CoA synthetase
MTADTVPARLLAQARLIPSAPAWFEKVDGEWRATSWAEHVAVVRRFGRALIATGVEETDRVCILAGNRSEWLIADVAALVVAAVPAGIYETCSIEEVGYILDHADARVVVVENAEQAAKVLAAPHPALRALVGMRGAQLPESPLCVSWEAFLARGDSVPPEAVDARTAALKGSDMGTFIYTSGTTGPPKAVMLSHENLAWTASAAIGMVGLVAGDCTLSYLPLAHIAEQMFTIHGPTLAGCPVYFVEARDKLPQNLVEVQPTVFFGVPRVWEKLHHGIQGKLKDATGVKAKLAAWAQRVGREVNTLRNQGQAPGALLGLQYSLANKLIFSKLKPKVGLGRARVCVSGAAPISADVLEFFLGLDIRIHEVYGQSEGCGPTTFNQPGATRLGTVGTAVPGCSVELAEDGEIRLKGPNVFLGYFKDSAATEACLIDGWLYSGDLGAKDGDGFFKIVGRKKEIIITSGGKNITPINIEAALKDYALISQAVVIGDRRNYLIALLTLEPEDAKKFADAHGVPVEGLHQHPALRAELQRAVDAVNSKFARVEHIRRFEVLPRDLSVEAGELTPTLKMKRRVIDKNWAEVIEGVYRAGGAQG